MHVDQAKAPALQAVTGNKSNDLVASGMRRRRQRFKEIENFRAISQVPAGKLADHQRMKQHLFPCEQDCQRSVAAP